MGRSAKQAKDKKKAAADARQKMPKSNENSMDGLSENMSSVSVKSSNFNSSAEASRIFDEQKSQSDILNSHIARTTTGVLASVPSSRDVKIEQFSMQFHGRKLIENTTLDFTVGRRYGLLGENGSGMFFAQNLKLIIGRQIDVLEVAGGR